MSSDIMSLININKTSESSRIKYIKLSNKFLYKFSKFFILFEPILSISLHVLLNISETSSEETFWSLKSVK